MEENGRTPSSATYNFIIQGLLEGNKLYEARLLLEEMRERGFMAESSTVTVLMNPFHEQKKDEIIVQMSREVVPAEIFQSVRVETSVPEQMLIPRIDLTGTGTTSPVLVNESSSPIHVDPEEVPVANSFSFLMEHVDQQEDHQVQELLDAVDSILLISLKIW